jgi:hypothetical protein
VLRTLSLTPVSENWLLSDPLRELVMENEFFKGKNDDLVKSLEIKCSVIPAKAGIQSFRSVTNHLDSGFHPRIESFRGRLSDDFLRSRQKIEE